jgi:hypothetical protein
VTAYERNGVPLRSREEVAPGSTSSDFQLQKGRASCSARGIQSDATSSELRLFFCRGWHAALRRLFFCFWRVMYVEDYLFAQRDAFSAPHMAVMAYADRKIVISKLLD